MKVVYKHVFEYLLIISAPDFKQKLFFHNLSSTLVSANPTIECNADKFTVNIETKKAYEGNVYVKGFFDRPGCRVEGKGQTKLSITLRFDAADPCGMRRRRQVRSTCLNGSLSMSNWRHQFTIVF